MIIESTCFHAHIIIINCSLFLCSFESTSECISCLFQQLICSSPIFVCFAQVVAITVFFLLSVAYYAFFAPFLGKNIYEYAAIGVYSFFVSSILFILSAFLVPLKSTTWLFSLSYCLN